MDEERKVKVFVDNEFSLKEKFSSIWVFGFDFKCSLISSPKIRSIPFTKKSEPDRLSYSLKIGKGVNETQGPWEKWESRMESLKIISWSCLINVGEVFSIYISDLVFFLF